MSGVALAPITAMSCRGAAASSSVRESLSLLLSFPDSHCHVRGINPPLRGASACLPPSLACAETLCQDLFPSQPPPVKRLAMCATGEHDWPLLQGILEALRRGADQSANADADTNAVAFRTPLADHRVVAAAAATGGGGACYARCGFGIHPWWAAGAADGALARLEALLVQYPEAFVGEIGIDTSRTTPPPTPGQAQGAPADGEEDGADTREDGRKRERSAAPPAADLERQRAVFEQQMALAAKHRRPVSVHVVGKGAYGAATEYFTRIAQHNQRVRKERLQLRQQRRGPVSPSQDLSVPNHGGLRTGVAPCVASEDDAEKGPLPRPSPAPALPMPKWALLPTAVIFHAFTGSAEFLHTLHCLFPPPPTTPGGDAARDRDMDSDSCALPTTRFFVGCGPRTTLRAKATRAALLGCLRPAQATTDPTTEDNPLPLRRASKPKSNSTAWKVPSQAALLESDDFFNIFSGPPTFPSLPAATVPSAVSSKQSHNLAPGQVRIAVPCRGIEGGGTDREEQPSCVCCGPGGEEEAAASGGGCCRSSGSVNGAPLQGQCQGLAEGIRSLCALLHGIADDAATPPIMNSTPDPSKDDGKDTAVMDDSLDSATSVTMAAAVRSVLTACESNFDMAFFGDR